MPKKQPQRQSNMLPILLIAFGLVLVLGVIIWQALSTTSTAVTPTAQVNPPAAQQNIPAPEIERVSLTDSKAAFDNQQAVFLDVRDADSYTAGHIPGSINIPLSELETRFSELNPADWIITYCT